MKETIVKRKVQLLGMSAGLVMSLGAGIVAPTPAEAVPPVAHPGATLAAAGSDTTYFVMNGLSDAYNLDALYNSELTKDRIINVPPLVTVPFPAGAVLPAEGACGEVIYKASNVPPNGSSAGISALTSDTLGCVDFARSSRGKKTTDAATLEFYAYGLDALTWVKFPGSAAPVSLTQQQLINIYTCNAVTGLPIVSNWSQVGGANVAIKKYAPQTSSGTYSFWNSKILNGATIDQNCNLANKSIFVEEHDSRGVSVANRPGAINPFAFGQWVSAANALVPDRRAGSTLQQINGLAPTLLTIKEAVAGRFLGTRYVYNVLKTTSPRYTSVKRFAGADNLSGGFLCNNKGKVIMEKFGLVPLPVAATGGGVTLATTCRKNPADL
jgi:phosphate transport system substrate-binding protein